MDRRRGGHRDSKSRLVRLLEAVAAMAVMTVVLMPRNSSSDMFKAMGEMYSEALKVGLDSKHEPIRIIMKETPRDVFARLIQNESPDDQAWLWHHWELSQNDKDDESGSATDIAPTGSSGL